MDGIVLYSEMGVLINNKKQICIGNSYILLAIIQIDKPLKQTSIILDSSEIKIIKKVLYDQVKKTVLSL